MPSVSRLQTAKRQAASGRRDCGVLEFWRCDERIWGCYRRLSDLASKPFLVKPPQRMSPHEYIIQCLAVLHLEACTMRDSTGLVHNVLQVHMMCRYFEALSSNPSLLFRLNSAEFEHRVLPEVYFTSRMVMPRGLTGPSLVIL
jgi:hypothetical protein